ncbi:hypothetical protein D3C87_1698540 [compost metagenome]
MFGINGTDNGGRPQLQATAGRRWNQDVGLLAHRLQLQAGVQQQAGKALFHPVITGQAGTATTADQRRIDRQVDPGQTGKPRQRITQTAGGHLVTATGGVLGPTAVD